MTTKLCPACNVEKPLDMFYGIPGDKEYKVSTKCMLCTRELAKAYKQRVRAEAKLLDKDKD